MRLHFIQILPVAICFLAGTAHLPQRAAAQESPAKIKIGWVGPMTGELSKWGSYQAALLAEQELHAPGPASYAKFEFIYEDGKSQGKDAASAAQKLISVDRVKYILGGQCTRESLAIAPIAERAGVIMLAAITSNPFLTQAGDNIFRVTAVSTKGPEVLFNYAIKQSPLKRFAVIFEEADYPRPQAEKFRDLVEQSNLALAAYEGFLSGESDVRSILSKVRARHPDALFIATTSPDFAAIVMQAIRHLRFDIPIFGNENTGHAVNSSGADRTLFEGVTFAASKYDPESPKAKAFLDNYRVRYNASALPYGAYTAEPYDTAMLLAGIIGRCGDDPAAVKKCLYETRNYDGASGRFSIDANGDAVRDYEILRVEGGEVRSIASIGD